MQKNKINAIVIILAAAAMIVVLLLNAWRLFERPFVSRIPPGNETGVEEYPSYDLGAKAQFIKINMPIPGDPVASPLLITGEARGMYFEGSFPVEIRDANGKILGSGPAQAQTDWMVDAFVPFQLWLNFEKSTTPNGTLIFKKDNPSGLPENDDQAVINVRFAPVAPPSSIEPVGSAPCRAGGCSGQVCTDQTDLATTCEWREEYACYKVATCARQSDGACGWTPTQTLTDCLAKAKK